MKGLKDLSRWGPGGGGVTCNRPPGLWGPSVWAATRQDSPCHKKDGGGEALSGRCWCIGPLQQGTWAGHQFTHSDPTDQMFFVIEFLAFSKLSYCITADILPLQAFLASVRSDPGELAMSWPLKLSVILHSTTRWWDPPPILVTKPIMLGLKTQVRTTHVCARCPICYFRNVKSHTLVLPFSKILLSCSDLQCLGEWFWSGSDYLVLKRNVLQVNHFEPGTKLSPREIHGPVWMEQGNKSKCCSFFFLFFVALDFILVSC